MKKSAYILSLFLFVFLGFTEGVLSNPPPSKEIKTLVLIIASDGTQAYIELQKIWKSYMNLDPEHFEVYFIRGDSTVNGYEIKGNDLIVKTEESYKPGIMIKTVLSIEALLPRLNEFDFVLRTNLSSFYIFPRLLNFLKTLPKTGCYCGVRMLCHPGLGFPPCYRLFVSGAGIIMSTDLAKMMVDEKETFLKESESIPDDVLMGYFFENKHIYPLEAHRRDFPNRFAWYFEKKKIGENEFHFRAKPSFNERSVAEDCSDELFINRQLLKRFYGISIENPNKPKSGAIHENNKALKSMANHKILLGVLIKNNDKLIPSFLDSLEHLNYDKKLIHLQIGNCNDSIAVKEMLKGWIEKNSEKYGHISYIDYVSSNLDPKVSPSSLSGKVNNAFLTETKARNCAYCFILESETYIAPETLVYLLEKNKPVISPLLKPIPHLLAHSRNFYVSATENGYYKENPDYLPIAYNQKTGVFKVDCLKSVFLIRADAIDKLTFEDDLKDLDFLSFCRSANKHHVDQYICNEMPFGYFLHHDRELSKSEEKSLRFFDEDSDFYEYLFAR